MPNAAGRSTDKARLGTVVVDDHLAEGDFDLARRVLQSEADAVLRLIPMLTGTSGHGSAGPSSAGPSSAAASFSRAIDLIVTCAESGGSVLVTGLGKSGLIGQKISATLASVGITSHFVHPAEAAHGDLGRFRAADLCIALSYSGETDEVVNLCEILHQDHVAIIAITRGSTVRSAPGSIDAGADLRGLSTLERVATITLPIGACDDAEISPAPTASTTATLALGDALALCAARRRRFTDDDFAKRHPGGSLGGLLRPVTDILRFRIGQGLDPVPDHLTVAEALAQADQPGVRRPGAMLMVDAPSGRLTGIFTDADLRRLILRSTDELSRPISTLMSRNPTTLPDTALVRDAVRLVRENRRDEIPVVDAVGRPVGILDVQDLIAMKLVKD